MIVGPPERLLRPHLRGPGQGELVQPRRVGAHLRQHVRLGGPAHGLRDLHQDVALHPRDLVLLELVDRGPRVERGQGVVDDLLEDLAGLGHQLQPRVLSRVERELLEHALGEAVNGGAGCSLS